MGNSHTIILLNENLQKVPKKSVRCASSWQIPRTHQLRSFPVQSPAFTASAALTTLLLFAMPSASAQQLSLMQMISQWQYPGSAIDDAQMSDGATLDADGNRTVPSVVCKTDMVTDASVDEVLDYYKAKLKPGPQSEVEPAKPTGAGGRSVVFSDDSEGRPFALHTVMVNTRDTSTMLVISRGKDEAKTHIGWKHYRRITP